MRALPAWGLSTLLFSTCLISCAAPTGEPAIEWRTKVEYVEREVDPRLFQCAAPPLIPPRSDIKDAADVSEILYRLDYARADCRCQLLIAGRALDKVNDLEGCIADERTLTKVDLRGADRSIIAPKPKE